MPVLRFLTEKRKPATRTQFMTLSNSKIVIIDPDDDFRKALYLFLDTRKNANSLTLFENVEASSEALMKNKYDAIIIDYWQARMNGSDFFRLAEELQPDAKKIIVYDNDIKNGIPGNYTIVRKPFSGEEFETLIKISGSRVPVLQAPDTAVAERIVRNHVIGAMGAGLLPIPLVDMAALTGVQLSMLKNLAYIFRIPFCRDRGKHLIATLVGSALPAMSAATLVSFFKTIPLVGQVFGALTLPVSGGAATYAIGRVFIQHFASGGTFLNFDPDKVRDHYAEMFKRGNLIAVRYRHSV